MESKEYMQHELNELEDLLERTKKECDKKIVIETIEKNIELTKQVIKDLEKYEELIYLLSRTNKQITLNNRNNVQTLILDLSDLNPNIKQDIYKLIVKEK